MRRIPLLSALFILLFAGGLFAASAVYYCTSTGALGYAYNASTVQAAKDLALQTCRDYGGTTPTLNNSSAYGGFGVVMIGYDSSNRRWCSSLLSATSYNEAINACAEALASVGATYEMSYDKFFDQL